MMDKKQTFKYAVCINNADYEVSLEILKIYKVIPDDKAFQRGLLRIVDESGEDYLYPQEFFEPIDLPQTVERLFSPTV